MSETLEQAAREYANAVDVYEKAATSANRRDAPSMIPLAHAVQRSAERLAAEGTRACSECSERRRLEELYPRRKDVAKLDTDCEIAEATVARLRADLAALVPLARVGHGYITARLAGQEGVSDAILALAAGTRGLGSALSGAGRVLAAYDREG